MATIRWCPIYPSHGTFNNPCLMWTLLRFFHQRKSNPNDPSISDGRTLMPPTNHHPEFTRWSQEILHHPWQWPQPDAFPRPCRCCWLLRSIQTIQKSRSSSCHAKDPAQPTQLGPASLPLLTLLVWLRLKIWKYHDVSKTHMAGKLGEVHFSRFLLPFGGKSSPDIQS